MLVSRTWLESLLAPGREPTGDVAFGEVLTSLGLEVEGITRVGTGLEAIVVARVEAIAPHPRADALRLVTLFDGEARQTVVCGAANVPAPGGKVALARLGTVLPGGLEIAAREIRGVASEGMICAEDELGIGPDDTGILVLPETWEAGDRLADRVPGIVDTIFALGITPNRPDALGHVGVARDLAVKLGRALKLPTRPALEAAPAPALVTLTASDRCGRYLGRTFEGVTVKPSPLWLRVRLHRLGLRPINNVVDITNFVLLEWGQPLHAFDRDRLAEERVVVRTARAKETLRTLDGRTLELDPDDLVIADARAPQALAGVMGGEPSGVEDGTRRLLLEVAWFAPPGIRRTARRHQIHSDSSFRFERGVDPGAGLGAAADRASGLLCDLAGARLVGESDVLGERPEVPTIRLRPARTALVLGMDVPDDEATRILVGLGVEVDHRDKGLWQCRPPTHRPDLQREEDLIEELMRHHGLDRLPSVQTMPSAPPQEPGPAERELAEDQRKLRALLEALIEAGLHEQISLVFTPVEDVRLLEDEVPLARAVRITNPMRQEADRLRTHLLPGLLRALAINVARHTRPVRLFELGRVYAWPEGVALAPILADATADIDATLAIELQRAGVLVCAGRGTTPESTAGIALGELLVGVLDRVHGRARLLPSPPRERASWLHPGIQARLAVVDEDGDAIVVGRFGEVHPEIVRHFDLPDGVRPLYGEIWVERLPVAPIVRYRALPRFPTTSRDLSLDLDLRVPAATILDALVEAERRVPAEGDDPPRLAHTTHGEPAIAVVEDYRGTGIERGRRALLLRLDYGAIHRSVTDLEVQARHEAVVASATTALRTLDPSVKPR